MNRHQLLACASAEMQTALKTYTHPTWATKGMR